jgi:hypothetical protein
MRIPHALLIGSNSLGQVSMPQSWQSARASLNRPRVASRSRPGRGRPPQLGSGLGSQPIWGVASQVVGSAVWLDELDRGSRNLASASRLRRIADCCPSRGQQ